MGVSRTDYLFWGSRIDPDWVEYEKHEAEMYQEDGRRFDIIRDGMSGQYAVAGKIIAKSDPSEGLDFQKVERPDDHEIAKIMNAVLDEFPQAGDFGTYLFSHFH